MYDVQVRVPEHPGFEDRRFRRIKAKTPQSAVCKVMKELMSKQSDRHGIGLHLYPPRIDFSTVLIGETS